MDDSSPDQHQDYRITIAREREEGKSIWHGYPINFIDKGQMEQGNQSTQNTMDNYIIHLSEESQSIKSDGQNDSVDSDVSPQNTRKDDLMDHGDFKYFNF